MFRTLIFLIGSYAAYHTNMQSHNILYSTIFPIINAFYLMFLLVVFYGFLRALATSEPAGADVDVVDLIYDVASTLYDEIYDKYEGKLDFLGSLSDKVIKAIVPVEVVLIIISFWKEIELIAHLAA